MSQQKSQRCRKVLFVESGETGGGSFQSLIQLISAMDRRAYEPVVAFTTKTRHWDTLEAMGVRCHLLPDPAHDGEWRRAHPLRTKLLDAAVGLAARFLPPASLRIALAVHAAATESLCGLIEQEAIDLLHTNNQPNRDLYAIEAARRSGIPCICHIRSFFTQGFTARKARFANGAAARFIPYSEHVADVWARAGLERERMTVVPNAIGDMSPRPLDIHVEYGIPATRKVVGIVGKIIPERRHKAFLAVFAQACRQGADAHLLVIGKGTQEDMDDLRAQCRSLDIADRVTFGGESSQAAEIIAALSLLVLPYNIEPFGRVLLEAWAIGTPVAVSDVGRIAELVTHGHDGLILPLRDEQAWADAICSVLSDADLASALADNGKATCKRLYHVSAQWRRLREVYDAVLSRSA